MGLGSAISVASIDWAEQERAQAVMYFNAALARGIPAVSLKDLNLHQLHAASHGLSLAQVLAIADFGSMHAYAAELGIPYKIYADVVEAQVMNTVEEYVAALASKSTYAPEIINALQLDQKIGLLVHGATLIEAQNVNLFVNYPDPIFAAIKAKSTYAAEQRTAFETGVRLYLDLAFAKQLMAQEEGGTSPMLQADERAFANPRIVQQVAELIGPEF